MQELIEELHILEYINVSLVLFLLAIGFIIKHTKINKFEINNQYIPPILFILAIIINLLSITDFSKLVLLNSLIDASISAALAIGIHNSGKGILKLIVKKYVKS